MRLVGLVEAHRRAEKYKSLFKRAMKLARQYRDERDAARREVWAMENSDAAEVVALESRVRILEKENGRLRSGVTCQFACGDPCTTEQHSARIAELERARQEARDSARTAGQLIRLVRDNGWMTEEEILALPDEAPRLAAAAGRPRRYRRKEAEQAQALVAELADELGQCVDAYGHVMDISDQLERRTALVARATSAPQPKDACNCQSLNSSGPWHPVGDTPSCPQPATAGGTASYVESPVEDWEWKPTPLTAGDTESSEHRCPRCGSTRWVSVSLDEGYSRRAQCVPCGKVYDFKKEGAGDGSPEAA